MQLAKIIGKVISTRKTGKVRGLKIFVVQYLNDELQELPKTVACIDSVGAGVGEIVLLCSSSSARLTKLTNGVCTDNTIVGIVDTISKGKKTVYHKAIVR